MARTRLHHRILLLAIIDERRRQRDQQQQRRPRARRFWQRLWVERRRDLGQFYNLFEVLDRDFNNDYRQYLRLDRDLFAEVLRRVAPRITKSTR